MAEDAVTEITSDVPEIPDSENEAILDAEINKARFELPPTPPPRGPDAILESLTNPGPSGVERAEEATITRLAAAGQVEAPADSAD